jgi:hypothetical protein
MISTSFSEMLAELRAILPYYKEKFESMNLFLHIVLLEISFLYICKHTLTKQDITQFLQYVMAHFLLKYKTN